MFGIELTLGQKLQIGFVVLVFGLAGVLFLRDTHAPVDMTINSWAQQVDVGVDAKRPVSAKNPADPAKSELVTFFACHDGKLKITEYTPESGLRADFGFVPDLHRPNYDFYKDPMARVNVIKDPYKHTLTFAAYSAMGNLPQQRLIFQAGLDGQQLKTEKDARQAMLDNVTLMEEGAKTGNYHPDMYEKVMAALAAYKAASGDPAKDPAKAKLAHKVMDLAMGYISQMDADKAAAVDKYVATLDGVLKQDQKDKLGEAVKFLAARARPWGGATMRTGRGSSFGGRTAFGRGSS